MIETILEEITLRLPDTREFWRTTIRLVFAILLGGVIGIQREQSGKPAGVRTHMLVALGAAVFVLRIDGMKRLTPDSTWWHRVPHREITRSMAQGEGGQPWTILASICTRGKARSVSWPREAS